jgi:hypothetical protein
MLRHLAFARTNVSKKHISSIVQATIIGEQQLRLLVTSNAVHSSPIFVTLMIEALRSSETSVLTRVTWRNTPEDGILHNHHSENLKSYIALTGWAL